MFPQPEDCGDAVVDSGGEGVRGCKPVVNAGYYGRGVGCYGGGPVGVVTSVTNCEIVSVEADE